MRGLNTDTIEMEFTPNLLFLRLEPISVDSVQYHTDIMSIECLAQGLIDNTQSVKI